MSPTVMLWLLGDRFGAINDGLLNEFLPEILWEDRSHGPHLVITTCI